MSEHPASPILTLAQVQTIRGSDLLAAVEALIERESACIRQDQEALVIADLRKAPCHGRTATSIALSGVADFIREVRLRGETAQAAKKAVPAQVVEAVNVIRSAFIRAHSVETPRA